MNIQVSLICTTKNEEETIRDLLESIISQTRLPDEIVFVDGGSSDETVKIIKRYIVKLPIKLISCTGANIAKGRNIAIENASYDFIACVDGGCKLDKNWLKNIIMPFEKSQIDIVSGVYSPWCKSEFEEIASYFIFPDINKLSPSSSFLPSSRSIAYKKSIWDEVNGYPEWLPTAEDTYFDLKCKELGASFTLANDAIVYWRVRKSFRSVFKQFSNYARGDGLAFLFPMRYFVRYFAFFASLFLLSLGLQNFYALLLLSGILLAVLWTKYLRKILTPSFKRLSIGIGIALTIEIGNSIGFIKGLLARLHFDKKVLLRK